MMAVSQGGTDMNIFPENDYRDYLMPHKMEVTNHGKLQFRFR